MKSHFVRRFAPVLLLALLSTGVIVACKQGEGDRCQVTDDCQSGLVCNQGTNPPSCQESGGLNQIDAQVPDVTIEDAPPDSSDAAPDA